MELKHYRVVSPGGEIQYRSVPVGALPPRWEKGAPRPVPVPRLPDDFEDWDDARGCFVTDTSAKADHRAGPDAIARAHALKSLEAILILSGLEVEGLIAAEARALGLEIRDLAQSIRAKTQPLIDAEVARRVSKSAI